MTDAEKEARMAEVELDDARVTEVELDGADEAGAREETAAGAAVSTVVAEDPSRASHSAPGARVLLSWEKLTYEVDDTLRPRAQGEAAPVKEILHGLAGRVEPGEVVCVMGPSGCGKTSLLNVLADKASGRVSGTVLVNGEPRPAGFQRLLGYVTQADHFIPALTVYETLDFAARLKLPVSVEPLARHARIMSALRDLDLEEARHSRVGVVGNGISGGERRRLAIAVAIIDRPPLLLLDEPTSGLDAAAAVLITRVLRRLAAQGSAVLCTVHQPRASVFRSFSSVLLLGAGRNVYFGPPGDECLAFFRSCGHECPPFENPADWVLDLINSRPAGVEGGDKAAAVAADDGDDDKAGGDGGGQNETRDEMIERLGAAFAASDAGRKAVEAPASYPPPLVGFDEANDACVTPWWNQATVVAHRSFLNKLREPVAMMTQGFNSLFMPLLVGAVFFQLDNDLSGTDQKLRGLSLISVMLSMLAFDNILLFPVERALFLRESSQGLYRASAFYSGRSVAELPQVMVFSLISASIYHLMMGFRGAAFGMMLLLVEALALCGAAFTIMVGAVSKTFEQANILASALLMLMYLFDGSWVPVDQIPAALRWIGYLSYLGYAVDGLVTNEISGTTIRCGASDLCTGTIDGDDYLDARGFGDLSPGTNVIVLVAIGVGFRAIAYAGLRYLYRDETTAPANPVQSK